MKRFKKYVIEVLTEPQRQYVSKEFMRNLDPKRISFTDHIFGGPDVHTTTIPFKTKTEAPESIKKHLDAAGYDIHDYDAGLAVAKDSDKPRPIRIGKVLENTKHLPTHQEAHTDFINRKINSDGEHEILITRDPHKIAEMSTNKPWVSCMALGNCHGDWDKSLGDEPPHFAHLGTNSHRIAHDISHGSHVAYLIRKGDTELRSPLMRVTLKPYTHEHVSQRMITNHKILLPDNVYADSTQSKSAIDDFHSQVSDFFDRELNDKQPSGKYIMGHGHLPHNLYADRLSKETHRFNPQDLGKLSLEPNQSHDDMPSREARNIFDTINYLPGGIRRFTPLLRIKNLHPHFLGKIAKEQDLEYALSSSSHPSIHAAYKSIINHKNFNQSVMNNLINHGVGEGFDLRGTETSWDHHLSYQYRPEFTLDLMHHPKVKSGNLDLRNHMNRLQHILFEPHPNDRDMLRGLDHQLKQKVSDHITKITRSSVDERENPYTPKLRKSLKMLADKMSDEHFTQILDWNSREPINKGIPNSKRFIDHITKHGILDNEKHFNRILDHLDKRPTDMHDEHIIAHLWYNHRNNIPAGSHDRIKRMLSRKLGIV
jgi:hypothetical protein